MKLRIFRYACFAAVLPGTGASYVWGGASGFTGFLLGVGATAFGIWLWWLILGIMAGSSGEASKPSFGTFLVLLGFLIKLPLYVAAAMIAMKIGGNARPCFLLGLGLVYFALVGWSLARDAGPP